MASIQIFLIAVTVALVATDDSCPAKSEISPCTCDGEGFNCMGARTVEEVRKAFRAKFKYGGVRSVWVQGTPITNVPADLFGNVKSQHFYIEVNNISSVNLDAFSASKKTLKTLSLFSNKLTKVELSGLALYENLNLLNLGRNQITSIPDDAFSSKSITTIILAQNQISHVGKNAFSDLPNLAKIEMTLNSLTTLGPMSFASKGHSAALTINLASNHISSVSSTAFQGTTPKEIYFSQNKLTSLPQDPFANLITRIAQKQGYIYFPANPFSCTGCDYSWIVRNKDILYSRFIGFTCTDGRSIMDLTNSGIQCFK